MNVDVSVDEARCLKCASSDVIRYWGDDSYRFKARPESAKKKKRGNTLTPIITRIIIVRGSNLGDYAWSIQSDNQHNGFQTGNLGGELGRNPRTHIPQVNL